MVWQRLHLAKNRDINIPSSRVHFTSSKTDAVVTIMTCKPKPGLNIRVFRILHLGNMEDQARWRPSRRQS